MTRRGVRCLIALGATVLGLVGGGAPPAAAAVGGGRAFGYVPVRFAVGHGGAIVVPTRGQARAADPDPDPDPDPVSYVDPFIGTGEQQPAYAAGGAHAFPGADVPFGMVQWSPDTTTDRNGSYTFGDPAIVGFSLTHLHGVGCPIQQDIPFMPTRAPPLVSPAADRRAYATPYTHADERATPGYYSVRLGSGIRVELTATTRTGFGRFSYPAATDATMVINAGGSIAGDAAAGVRIDPASGTVTGSATSGGFCSQSRRVYTPRNSYTVYFAARFDRPFARYGTWSGPALVPGATATAGVGARSGAYLTFDTRRNPVVRVKVGVSYVGVQGALANLRAESAGWDFAAARAAARARWAGMLGRVRAQGGAVADRRTFYTALYHVLLHPNVFGDAGGRYRGFDRRVHTAVYGSARTPYTQYANYSGWDIYRAEVPLLALLAPRETGDMMQSLVSDAQQSGGGTLPRWSLANIDTGVMVGDPADPIIAGAYAFGATHFDTGAALDAMVAGATRSGSRPDGAAARPGLAEYLRLGWVPYHDGKLWGPAATTLEYTSADFALSRFAAALGRPAVSAAFQRRSENWRRLFNPATGYIQPRWADGRFVAPFDPSSEEGFVEGSAAQYLWMAPYDLRGLADALGGRVEAARRLDTFFAAVDAGRAARYAYFGNEPSQETPWEYDAFGQPWRAQETVRRIMRALYRSTPDGIPGNDDLGQLSAWYVWAALGVYPEIPGAPVLTLNSPLFPRVTLRLAGGDVTIDGQGAADGAPYVQSLLVDGRPYDRPWLPLSLLAHGARLRFALGPRPNKAWGSDPSAAPPSFGPAPRPTPTTPLTASPAATASPSPTASPAATASPQPVATASSQPVATVTASPSPTPTAQPSLAPGTPTPLPPGPTATVTLTVAVTATVTPIMPPTPIAPR